MTVAKTTTTTFRNPTFDYWDVWASKIATLRANIGRDKIIYFADMNTIRDGINSMMAHYHGYTDLYQNAEYGNNGDRNTYTVERNSDGAIPVASRNALSASFAQGGTIYWNDHDALRLNTALIRSHQHGGLDQNTA